MSLEIIPVNGHSNYLNYRNFQHSIEKHLSKTCSNAKIYIFNNFPIALSPEFNIDLMLIIALEPKEKNYFQIWKYNKNYYLKNLIIPIKYIDSYRNDNLTLSYGSLVNEEGYIDLENQIKSIGKNLKIYLKKCNLNKGPYLIIDPVIFIENDANLYFDNHIIDSELTFDQIIKYLNRSSQKGFNSYYNWSTESGFNAINEDIKNIMEQASKDAKFGYLTKKKIERIGKDLTSNQFKKISSKIGEKLIIINGKAGTGKTSTLISLAITNLLKRAQEIEGKNTIFITYNNILVYNISATLKSVIDSYNNNSKKPLKYARSQTIHKFFYTLSKNLGITFIMEFRRFKELNDILESRMKIISKEILNNQNFPSNYEKLKSDIQYNDWDIGKKELGLDFINYLTPMGKENDYESLKSNFIKNKKDQLKQLEDKSDLFIEEYYEILRRILILIKTPEQYFDDYIEDINNEESGLLDRYSHGGSWRFIDKLYSKYEQKYKDETGDIENIKLKEKAEKHFNGNIDLALRDYWNKKKLGLRIQRNKLIEYKNRSIGGTKSNSNVFIDEAQDCHPNERDILIHIFGSNNITITNGGKEQLIRHTLLCNWNISNGQKIDTFNTPNRNKSYRMKKEIASFCNFFANEFNIVLDLKSLESDDHGELIFNYENEYTIEEIFKKFITKGEINGCVPYESILVLLDARKQEKDKVFTSEMINEYNNLESSINVDRKKWKYKELLENISLNFWDGTSRNKREIGIPGFLDTSLIYYESCRGTEAWNVACMSIDDFFNSKLNEPEAEKFLLDDEKGDSLKMFLTNNDESIVLTNEKRKELYAATWTLMAMTRAIDTLFLDINNINSKFGMVVKKYLDLKSIDQS